MAPQSVNRFILAFLYFFSFIYAQSRDFRFSHLTTNDGLSQSNVTCILQDNKGFMWVGTFNGLNRFDGYTFETFHYRQNEPHHLSYNYISALVEDRNGYLWVGTSDGLNRYDRKTDSFYSFKYQQDDPQSISDNSIEAILEDQHGRLWIGTRHAGLELFDARNETFSHHLHDENDKHSLSSNVIQDLYEDSDGNIWIAHWNGAIDILFADTNNSELSFQRQKITDTPITAIVESENNHIWIGTQGDGLYCFELKDGTLQRIAHFSSESLNGNHLNSNIILCLMADSRNTLWIGTEDNGINLLDLKTNTFTYCTHDPFVKSSLSHNSIWDIYEDHSGNIWIGTFAHGINLLTDRIQYFQHYQYHPGKENGLSNNMVKAFVEDKKGDLWIATDGGGLNFFDRRANRFARFNTENSDLGTDVIVSLLQDQQDRLWLGTWTRGLYLFDRTRNTWNHYSKETHGLASDRILHICEDRDGGLWLSTYKGGLTYFNIDTPAVRVYDSQNSGLSDNYVRVVMQDLDGQLWIGTDLGLELFDARTQDFIHFKHNENENQSLSKGFVHSIVQLSDSSLWIGTTGGLNRYNPETKSFIHYSIRDGLPNDEIKCIIKDHDGALWLSTNKGISRFDRTSTTFRNYDVSDGLQGNEFNIRSGLLTSSGEIAFGGNNGFNLFETPILKENRFIPPVVITDFKIFNRSVPVGHGPYELEKHISETQQLTLAHHHTVFSFSFVALNYVSPARNQYAYMMEGFESEWNVVGSRRTATYTNLDPGTYVFRVKASNNNGYWNERGAAVQITIKPPFWKTWWAYLIVLFLAFAVIGFVFNYFISRQRLKNELRMEHLDLEKMYEMDQMKTHFFTNIAHEFYSPLTLILSPIEKLITSGDLDDKIRNSLILIHRNAQRLRRMTSQLKDIQKLETDDLKLSLSRGDIIRFIDTVVRSFQDYAADRRIRFEFETTHDIAVEWFDPDKLDKIIYNLLSNAFKFTPDNGEIKVLVSILSAEKISEYESWKDKAVRCIEISVQDSGIGIPENKIKHIFRRFYHAKEYQDRHFEGSGVGLAFVYELVQLYGAEISVNSEEGQGSEFVVQIPLDEHYLEENQFVGEFNISTFDSLVNQGLPPKRSSDLNDVQLYQLAPPIKDIPIILIVEDDEEIREYIAATLESKYRIIVAKNGAEGIKKATKTIPDLIISDIKMPEIEGTELCTRLKDDQRTSHVPIILLTAYTSRDAKIKGLHSGADAYLFKPFNVDELQAQVINLLQSRRKLRAKFGHGIIQETAKLTNLDEQFLQRIIGTIEQHIDDSTLTADVLSKQVGMSRMQLYRKIRALTDQTVHELIRTIRLKKAVQILEGGQMTITETAFAVGFNDLTYFARCFRKQYKKSPSEFLSSKNV